MINAPQATPEITFPSFLREKTWKMTVRAGNVEILTMGNDQREQIRVHGSVLQTITRHNARDTLIGVHVESDCGQRFRTA